jgi:hypothetical protein
VLSFFLVALGVAYPAGSLLQGPVIDRIGIGATTAGTALLLLLIMALTALRRPGFIRSVTGGMNADPTGPADPGGPGDPADLGDPADPGDPVPPEYPAAESSCRVN